MTPSSRLISPWLACLPASGASEATIFSKGGAPRSGSQRALRRKLTLAQGPGKFGRRRSGLVCFFQPHMKEAGQTTEDTQRSGLLATSANCADSGLLVHGGHEFVRLGRERDKDDAIRPRLRPGRSGCRALPRGGEGESAPAGARRRCARSECRD